METIIVDEQNLIDCCVNYLISGSYPLIDIAHESENYYCDLSDALDSYFDGLNLPFMVTLNYDVLETIATKYNNQLP